MKVWAYSVDLRERAVGAYRAGEGSQRAVARRFDIPQSTLVGWLRHAEETGSLVPKRPTGRPPMLSAEQEQLVVERLKDRSDLTLEELADDLQEDGIHVSRQTVGRILKKLGWSRKKNGVRSGS